MTRLSSYGLRLMLFLSLGVALTSLRYTAIPWNIWIAVDDTIHALNARMPLPLFVHASLASVALAIGPFQFIRGLREHRPTLHRWMGRTYVTACIVGGVAAITVAMHAAGGPIAGAGFATLGAIWITTTFAAWRAAVARNFALHRVLMRYSFAMTFAAVTLRLQVPIGFAFFGFHDYATMSRWLAYTSWIPNVAAVWLFNLVRGDRAYATASRATA